MTVNQHFDGVFILTDRKPSAYAKRLRHTLAQQGVRHELIGEHGEIDVPRSAKIFEPNALDAQTRARVLQHIEAWKIVESEGLNRILVLQDDAVLAPDFVEGLVTTATTCAEIKAGYVIFLGAATNATGQTDTSSPLVSTHLPTTLGYIVNAPAAQKHLVWLKSNRVALPPEHLMRQIARDCRVPQYWLREPLVLKGGDIAHEHATPTADGIIQIPNSAVSNTAPKGPSSPPRISEWLREALKRFVL